MSVCEHPNEVLVGICYNTINLHEDQGRCDKFTPMGWKCYTCGQFRKIKMQWQNSGAEEDQEGGSEG